MPGDEDWLTMKLYVTRYTTVPVYEACNTVVLDITLWSHL